MAHGFVRNGTGVETKLDPMEIEMISQLLDELCDLLSHDDDVDPSDADPLAVELGLESLDNGEVNPPTDPVMARLLPDSYRDDPVASYEFRQYTDAALRRGKIEDAEAVRTALAHAQSSPEGLVWVDDAEAPSWLRAINDVRLALGVQLDISSESPHSWEDIADDDPRAAQAALYDFLTWWQDSLVRALTGDDEF